MEKLKPIDKSSGQFLKGGRHKMVPVWLERKKPIIEESEPEQPKPGARYKITFTFNLWNLLAWGILFFAFYFLYFN